MFKNVYQCGLITIFYSCGAKPLELWDIEVKNGHIKRITDTHVRSMVLEILGCNVSTTFITCPKGGKSLGINLPFMVLIVKNLKKHFTFEVTVLDEGGVRRRFRISNFQSTTQIQPLCTSMPITLNDGWNQIQFNLATFTQQTYKTQFVEVVKLKINANIRLRRVYFSETLLPEDRLPPEYKLYIPLPSTKKAKADKKQCKENIQPSPSKTSDKKESKVDVGKVNSKPSIKTDKKLSKDEIKVEKGQKPETVEAVNNENETIEAVNSENEEVNKENEELIKIEAVKIESVESQKNDNPAESAQLLSESQATTATEPTPVEAVNSITSPENADQLPENGTAETIETNATKESIEKPLT